MRRKICCVCVCVTLALTASYDAAAQSKKKGKEPELAISKRGNLIFEDDFAGKELGWVTKDGNWALAKKTLTENSTASGVLSATRVFSPTVDVVAAFRLCLPSKGWHAFGFGRGKVVLHFFVSEQSVKLGIYNQDTKVVDAVAVLPFVYKKQRWCDVIVEKLGKAVNVAVDGRTLKAEVPSMDDSPCDAFTVILHRTEKDVFAIDDVKVWEALPKDEEDEKDTKKKK
ncbi:MAG: hypothetical protein AB1696_20505 [Planctomycetota bacterium]